MLKGAAALESDPLPSTETRDPLVQDAPTTGEPARILLIEDDPQAVLTISEMLHAIWSERLVLVQALQVDGAAQELIDHGATCVLLTLELGGTRATEQIQALRTASPTAAIVVLCDSVDEELALQSLHAGAQDCLVKQDLYPALLRRTIRYAIERKRSEVELAELALRDPLTGLPNRALFLDRLGVALDRARRTGSTIAVLFVDVDKFKHINDTLGHGVGDTVLAGLARRLSGMLRPMDTIARFGGDEFTLLFEDLSSDREVVLIADRISRAAARPIPFEDGEAKVSVSVGVATVVDPSTPPETVIREADAAMYRAKELGRSRYELFDELSRTRALERLELEAALNHAVERSELRVHYQPKVSLSGELGVVGFEALVRWQHPERGLIGPAEFLPVAEETGTMLRIGEYVLDDALRQIARWRRLQPNITVSVNLSAGQLQDAGLVSMLAGQMRAAGIDPSALCVEVSEDAVTPGLQGRDGGAPGSEGPRGQDRHRRLRHGLRVAVGPEATAGGLAEDPRVLRGRPRRRREPGAGGRSHRRPRPRLRPRRRRRGSGDGPAARPAAGARLRRRPGVLPGAAAAQRGCRCAAGALHLHALSPPAQALTPAA